MAKQKIINPCPKCGAETEARMTAGATAKYERRCPACHWRIEAPTMFRLIDAYHDAQAEAAVR